MSPVVQMRLVVEADDYDGAVRFYRDTLGLTEELAVSGEGDARVMILSAGRATLEIANPAQKRMIDEVEVGRQVAPKMRVAFEVTDSAAVTDALVEAGAALIALPGARRSHGVTRPTGQRGAEPLTMRQWTGCSILSVRQLMARAGKASPARSSN